MLRQLLQPAVVNSTLRSSGASSFILSVSAVTFERLHRVAGRSTEVTPSGIPSSISECSTHTLASAAAANDQNAFVH